MLKTTSASLANWRTSANSPNTEVSFAGKTSSIASSIKANALSSTALNSLALEFSLSPHSAIIALTAASLTSSAEKEVLGLFSRAAIIPNFNSLFIVRYLSN